MQRLNPQTFDYSIASLAATYKPDAHVAGQSPGEHQPVHADHLGRGGRHRHPAGHLELQRRASRRTFAGAAARSPCQLNNNKQTTTSLNALFNPAYNTNWSAQYTQPLLRNFKIDNTRQQLVVTKLNQDISEIQLQALDHQHRLERAERLLGLRVRDAGGRSGAAVGGTRRAAGAATTRRASKSARWRRSTSSRRSRRRPRSGRTWRSPKARVATNELALKRLIVGGTQDPNWSGGHRSRPIGPTSSPTPIDVAAAVSAALETPHRSAAGTQEPAGQRRHAEVPAQPDAAAGGPAARATA